VVRDGVWSVPAGAGSSEPPLDEVW
jgi:hypothetical protein